MRHFLSILVVVLLAGPVRAQERTEPIQATDLFKIQQLGDVTASPDGRFVAYTSKTIVEERDDEGNHEYRTQLFVLPAGSDEPMQMTHGDRGGSDPNWHPESDRIAFVRAVDGKPQIFVMPLYGGESYQLTNFEYGATSPRWSPDGTRLLFAASLTEDELEDLSGETPTWSDERPARRPGDTAGAEADPDGSIRDVRAWLDENSAEGNPRVFTRLDLQGETDLQPEPRFRHYFVVDATQPMAEPHDLTPGFYSYGGGEWLPDGRQILFSGAPVEDLHPDRVRDSDLFLVDADGGRLNKLLDIEGYAVGNPTISPDGRTIAFLARAIDDMGYAQTELGIFGLDGQQPPVLLTQQFDRSLYAPRWSQDNWFLYFVAPSEGGFPLFRLSAVAGTPVRTSDVDEDEAVADTLAADSLHVLAKATFAADEVIMRDPEVERLTNPVHGIRSYDLTTATVYYVLTEAANPYELYGSNMDFTRQQRLTAHNFSWLQNKALSVPEKETLRQDTLRIDYWVMPPTFAERGRKYPMMLAIHGGPSAMWGPGEATMWHEFQFFAARGYGIVYSNPRGSGGYGYDFKRMNYQNWGDGPADDVLAVAREAVDDLRWADPERQVVSGGSYAGYLTAWIVGHDDRFQAAVAQRGVYDLPTFLGEGNAWRLVPSHFGGYPWETAARDTLDYNSPLTYVDAISTPLLIIHGDNDLRTGPTQSEVLYKSLKILEKPVEYVRYPNAGHDLSRTGDPDQRLDRILRIYEFMERYVGDGAASAAARDR